MRLPHWIMWWFIPLGMYCHGTTRQHTCPWWSRIEDAPKQEDGYCSYLREGDDSAHGGLLWDKCKECGCKDWRWLYPWR